MATDPAVRSTGNTRRLFVRGSTGQNHKEHKALEFQILDCRLHPPASPERLAMSGGECGILSFLLR
jgi:hypothetical protein